MTEEATQIDEETRGLATKLLGKLGFDISVEESTTEPEEEVEEEPVEEVTEEPKIKPMAKVGSPDTSNSALTTADVLAMSSNEVVSRMSDIRELAIKEGEF
ncbi:MAG: hypothetical protein F4X44_12280 [Gammaproteobacteria bacterium]|nr:hypothetical protein [Gammaproteobacteria bacterium]